MNFFQFYFFILFSFVIKSKSILNQPKLYINNSFDKINYLYENKTQIKNNFISFNNISYSNLIKRDNNYSIILSKNSYFLSSGKNILRNIEESESDKTDENNDTDEDSNEEIIFEEIKNNASEYYYNHSNIPNLSLSIIKFGNSSSSSSNFYLNISECESLLKELELINTTSSLYILQIEINREDEVVN